MTSQFGEKFSFKSFQDSHSIGSNLYTTPEKTLLPSFYGQIPNISPDNQVLGLPRFTIPTNQTEVTLQDVHSNDTKDSDHERFESPSVSKQTIWDEPLDTDFEKPKDSISKRKANHIKLLEGTAKMSSSKESKVLATEFKDEQKLEVVGNINARAMKASDPRIKVINTNEMKNIEIGGLKQNDKKEGDSSHQKESEEIENIEIPLEFFQDSGELLQILSSLINSANPENLGQESAPNENLELLQQLIEQSGLQLNFEVNETDPYFSLELPQGEDTYKTLCEGDPKQNPTVKQNQSEPVQLDFVRTDMQKEVERNEIASLNKQDFEEQKQLGQDENKQNPGETTLERYQKYQDLVTVPVVNPFDYPSILKYSTTLNGGRWSRNSRNCDPNKQPRYSKRYQGDWPTFLSEGRFEGNSNDRPFLIDPNSYSSHINNSKFTLGFKKPNNVASKYNNNESTNLCPGEKQDRSSIVEKTLERRFKEMDDEEAAINKKVKILANEKYSEMFTILQSCKDNLSKAKQQFCKLQPDFDFSCPEGHQEKNDVESLENKL